MTNWDGNIPGAEQARCDAGGIGTAYYRAGSGRTTILIHGGGAGANAYGNWRGCFPSFAERFDTVAMDMLGFGDTDKPSPDTFEYSQDARVRHLVAFIEAIADAPVNLVGNSMGGMTSLGAAIERPDLVNAVVLMGSAGIRAPMSDALRAISHYDETVAGMRRIVEVLTNPDFEVDEEMVAYRHALSVRDDTRAAYRATMGFIQAAQGLYYDEDYIARLERPALIVNGKVDQVIPVTSAYRLLELIPQSWGYLIPNCGHWAMIEHPADFTAACLQFLRE